MESEDATGSTSISFNQSMDLNQNLDTVVSSTVDPIGQVEKDVGTSPIQDLPLKGHDIEKSSVTTKKYTECSVDDSKIQDESLRCGLCKEYFNNPKLLPCMHSFCKSCLDPLFIEVKKESSPSSADGSCPETEDKTNVEGDGLEKETSMKQNGDKNVKKYGKCPHCEFQFEIPESGIEGLISNTVLTKVIKSQQKLLQQKDCDICKFRQISEAAAGFCTDCKDMLCQSCWKSHSFTRFTLNHKVVALEELNDVDLTNVIVDSTVLCLVHPDEQVKYFCLDCNSVICRECILLIHKDHMIISSSAAADNKRQEMEALVLGFNLRLDSLAKFENSEYQSQISGLDEAECCEIEKIDQFFGDLFQAIEKAKQDTISKTKEMFAKIKLQNTRRFSCFENVEQQMTGLSSILKLLLQHSSGEEFLMFEPVLHKRVLQMINVLMKPSPTSWYETPQAVLEYPLKIELKNQTAELSEIKVKPPKQKFEPVESIPVKHSLKELIELGKFKGIIRAESEQSIVTKTERVDPNFVDATVWGQPRANELRMNNDDIDDKSDSSWADDMSNDPSTEKTKRRRGKRGGKKNRAKKLAAATNNAAPPSGSMKSIHKPNMMSPRMGGSNFQPEFGGLYSNTPTSGFPYGVPMQHSSSYPSPAMQRAGSFSMLANKHCIPNVPSAQQTPSTSSPSNKTSKPPSGEEARANTTLQKISLKPKWRLDVKLSSDQFEPYLRGVYCLHKTSIIVSDCNNAKVKIFTADGQFIKSLELKITGRAIFTADMLIYSENQKVCGKKENGKDINAMSFGNTSSECLVAWCPKKHVLVACGNKIREYGIDTEKDCFIKSRNITVENGQLNEFCDVRCDFQGQKLVAVDRVSKTVIIFNFEGAVCGTYREDGWNPTSACMDKKGNVFVADGGQNRLVFLSNTGQFIQQWDTNPTIMNPSFVTTNPVQPLYITGNDRFVHVYDYSY